MLRVTYTISSGVFPITASLIGSGMSAIHNSYGQFFFENVPDGTYTLRIVDGSGHPDCYQEFPVITPTTSTTTTIYVEIIDSCCTSYLYNWFITQGTGNNSISSSDDWYVPDHEDINQLIEYVNPSATRFVNYYGTGVDKVNGGAQAAVNLRHRTCGWNNLVNNTDVYGFRDVASGYRTSSSNPNPFDEFQNIGNNSEFWTTTGKPNVPQYALCYMNEYYLGANDVWLSDWFKNTGMAVCLIKDAIGISDGNIVYYIGNDNKSYRAVAINQKYWTRGLKETKYRNGSLIAFEGVNSGYFTSIEWDNLYNTSTPAVCAYDNLWNECDITLITTTSTTSTSTTSTSTTSTSTSSTTTTTTTDPNVTTTTTTTGTPATTLKTNLISIYELDETSGTNVDDAYGINDGTSTSCTVNQTGKINKCYSFNGTTSIIDFNTRLISSFPFSISIWFNMDVAGKYIFASNRGITNYYGIVIYVDGTRVNVGFGDGNGAGSGNRKSYDYSTTLSTGTWYNLIITSTSINSADTKVYINGNILTASNPSGTATSVSWSSGESWLASNFSTATTNRFDGFMDQFAIWNKVLNLSEISSLYNSGNGLPYTSW